jgi:uncharacterized protein YndB with AHSA1/START domain
MTIEPNSIEISFPSDLEIELTTIFNHPIETVFAAHSQIEHVSKTFASFGETVTKCEIDLRVGGKYHYVMVTPQGVECSFRGKFLEVDEPNLMKQTWIFDGWAGVEAIETMTFEAVNTGTRYTWNLSFANETDRAYFSKTEGIESNFKVMHEYLKTIS